MMQLNCRVFLIVSVRDFPTILLSLMMLIQNPVCIHCALTLVLLSETPAKQLTFSRPFITLEELSEGTPPKHSKITSWKPLLVFRTMPETASQRQVWCPSLAKYMAILEQLTLLWPPPVAVTVQAKTNIRTPVSRPAIQAMSRVALLQILRWQRFELLQEIQVEITAIFPRTKEVAVVQSFRECVLVGYEMAGLWFDRIRR
mmetsp:Transcript_34992/g.49659  ORF Transcript_34992/g.49659 Transcript_34992/m.49659 type:complete len:201 (+) Transcript_34992:180-782(+)